VLSYRNSARKNASVSHGCAPKDLWSGCLGKPEPSASRTLDSGAPSRSSIRAAASRSGTVPNSKQLLSAQP
jgi:hypothetical protein